MTEILSHVISSRPLDNICGRELLGLLCVAPDYDCMCEQVESSEIETVQDDRGAVAVLTLRLLPNLLDYSLVRKNISLMGYRADWKVSAPAGLGHGTTIVVEFDLWRPQNAELLAYIAETGI